MPWHAIIHQMSNTTLVSVPLISIDKLISYIRWHTQLQISSNFSKSTHEKWSTQEIENVGGRRSGRPWPANRLQHHRRKMRKGDMDLQKSGWSHFALKIHLASNKVMIHDLSSVERQSPKVNTDLPQPWHRLKCSCCSCSFLLSYTQIC